MPRLFTAIEIPANVADALAAAKQGEFDAAILDINLSDGMAYPVAEILSERGVPFAFVTGYGTAGTDPAHADAPLLQKPFREGHLEAVVQLLRARQRPP